MSLYITEDGDGPEIVFLHPVGLDGSCWEPVTRELSRDHRVLCIDLPGHGRSPLGNTGPRLADYAASVEATIAEAVRGPYVLVGLSFGGMIAQSIAIGRPEGLRGLVACGCGSSFADAVRPHISRRGTDARAGGMAAVVETTLERWFTPGFLGEPAVAEVRAQLLNEDVESWVGAWEAISGLDTAPHLHQVAVPALCVAGTADQATSLDMVRQTAAAIPGGRLAEIEGAPHMMQIERPGELLAVLRPFIDGLGRGGTP